MTPVDATDFSALSQEELDALDYCKKGGPLGRSYHAVATESLRVKGLVEQRLGGKMLTNNGLRAHRQARRAGAIRSFP